MFSNHNVSPIDDMLCASSGHDLLKDYNKRDLLKDFTKVKTLNTTSSFDIITYVILRTIVRLNN